jgi:hypothetical protein
MSPGTQSTAFAEDRLGFDGKWDVGPGVWIEGATIRQNTDAVPFPWQHALTLGLDYTFDLGQGLSVMGEYLIQRYAEVAFGQGEMAQVAGASVRYPLGLLDDVTGIFYYDQKNQEAYSCINVTRTLDDWVFTLMLFANPDIPQLGTGGQRTLLLAGKGILLLAVFNH